MSKGVAVIGGGIAGVQAALDLAEQGIKVYIIEKTPSLGGKMAQLDKTFPTNDCSICILSPKLVAAGRHPNITLYTNSELKELNGDAGNFRAVITKRPRYITEEKCTACSLCAEACPVEIKSEFEEGIGNRKAIYIPFPQAVPLKYTIDRRGTPPCQASCPAGVHAQGYIALISQGKYKEALELHRETNPLPLICGRVCPHPCENECNRAEIDEPIAIAALKRFIADYELEHREEVEPFEKTSDKKVAVIGSGPAGLTVAYFLAKFGYNPTIFEALPVPGGMLAVGIPDYRLPKDILKAEIDYIKKKGVEIKVNTCFGKDFSVEDLKKDGFDAIFLGIGAHGSKKLAIPGEDLKDVIPGVEFLREVNLGRKVDIGKKVAVIGGGDVAIDAVRVANRLGSKAFILYRRTRNEMPAHESEVEETLKEGIEINYLVQPVKILGKNGDVVGLECIKMELGEPDESGRRRPVPIKGSEFTIDVDTVMPAIGQSPQIELLEGLGLNIAKAGTIIVDAATYATNLPGVFAAGDAVTGPATVVKAVGAGRKAAEAIDSYLKGKEVKVEVEEENIVTFDKLELEEGLERKERAIIPELPLSKRKKNFKEVVKGLSEEEALKEAKRCLNCGICSGCFQCIKVCEPDAIDFSQKDEEVELELSSVVVIPGYDQIDPETRNEYGYGVFDNVITALEFERILSASGPFGGHIQRISDGKEPEKIAFIQCVGSRDKNKGASYCSAVCCMYAIKEAIIAKEHSPKLDVQIFHMDIRAFGKEFDYYYQRAKDIGIKFTRCRVADIWEEENGKLNVNYVDEKDEPNQEIFDMVVLSNGIGKPKDAEKLSNALDIELNDHGFCKTTTFHPLETSRKGVFVGGAFSEPKDIPDSVAQASGAAGKASSLAEKVKALEPEVIEERDVSGEPRIGVLICHCGINIGNFVDVEEVAEYASSLPNVVYAENVLYACSQDIQDKIKNLIREHDLNRLVVASCTPRTHEPLFQGTIEEAGLNPYLFEMTNIREQCSWVHMHDKENATEKAKDLVRMTIAKSNLLSPLERESLSINPTCLVIGGGISGLAAAKQVADNGYKVLLLEKEKELGGNLKNVNFLLTGEDPEENLDAIIKEVSGHEKIELLCNANLKNIEGYVGNFTTIFEHEGETKTFEHGAIIVATGSKPYEPTEYLYGKHKGVITQLELEEMLGKKKLGANSIVMIQCVGSRDENHGYCSRVCCSQAVKNSLRIKEINPNADIYVLFKDMRTYGFREDYYTQASEKGVKFILYDDENKPIVKDEDGLLVEIMDPVLGKELELRPDIVVLSIGMEPREGNVDLAKMLKVPLSKDGFFLEAHMKLRPLDFANEGIFLCGAAHWPKFVDECISQASGAASRACTILSKEVIRAEGIVSFVDEELCFGCGICVLNCPYNAIELEEETQKAKVVKALCKGCGVCGATCPKHAIIMSHFTDKQVLAQIDAFVEEVG